MMSIGPLLLDKVHGMEVGLTISLENIEGTLKLSILECGCHVHDISIKLDGGASWLYQGYILTIKLKSLISSPSLCCLH